MDGTEVCRLIRARPATATLPIIMLTARTGESTACRVSTSAPTTTSPSRSACGNWRRASAPCSGGAPETAIGVSLYQGKHLIADFDAVIVTVEGEPIRLTRREFDS